MEVKDDVVGTGFTDTTISCMSLRVDAVAKSAMNVSRSKMEEVFLDSRLRLNGFKITRKAEWVNEGDVFDLIKGRNPENTDMLQVFRIEIRSIPDISSTTGKIKIHVRKYKDLTIANYTQDPWTGAEAVDPSE